MTVDRRWQGAAVFVVVCLRAGAGVCVVPVDTKNVSGLYPYLLLSETHTLYVYC